jgi:hypothetical protein
VTRLAAALERYYRKQNGDVHRRAAHAKLPLAPFTRPHGEERLDSLSFLRHHELVNLTSDRLFECHTENRREACVAKDDRSRWRQLGDAVAHRLEQHAIVVVRPFEGEDTFSGRPLSGEGVDLPRSDCRVCLFDLVQPSPKRASSRGEGALHAGGLRGRAGASGDSGTPPDVEPSKETVSAEKISDEPAARQRQDLDVRGRRDDLLLRRSFGRLVKVDDFDAIAPGDVAFGVFTQVLGGRLG